MNNPLDLDMTVPITVITVPAYSLSVAEPPKVEGHEIMAAQRAAKKRKYLLQHAGGGPLRLPRQPR